MRAQIIKQNIKQYVIQLFLNKLILMLSTATVVGMLIMEVSRLAIFTVCMLLYYYRGGYVDHRGEQAGYLHRLYVTVQYYYRGGYVDHGGE